VYDPTRKTEVNLQGLLPGKVVSGPAPRPPRTMSFDIKDGQIVITGTEGGGVG
jgi:Rieske Fe-S protein